MLRVLIVGLALGVSVARASAGEMVAWSYSAVGSVDGQFYVSGVPYTALETDRGAAAVIDPVLGHAPESGVVPDPGGVKLPLSVTLTDAASGEAGTVDLAYVLWGTPEGTVNRTLETFDPVTLTLGGTEYVVTPDDQSLALAVRVGGEAEAPTDTPVPAPSAPAPPGVPEPATGLLALLGVAGVAARRWRGR